MERKDAIYPANYKTRLEFAHVYCSGCINERSSYGNKIKRADECLSCLREQDRFYISKDSILIIRDEEGKNIAMSLELK